MYIFIDIKEREGEIVEEEELSYENLVKVNI